MNRYILYFVLITFFVGCTDNFEDFNTDKKNPAVVEGNALFSNGQKELMDQVNSTNVNLNIFKMMAQYWTETTYTDEANYNLVERNISGNIYLAYYREALKDMDEAARLIAEESDPVGEATKQNRLAIIEIMQAYAYNRLVDIFGSIIYSEALDIDNVYPAYESGATVYSDLINRVNTAIGQLDPGEGSFGASDLIYQGDVSAWIKFANTLKIKMGITLADYDASLAASTITSAVDGAFGSSADDAILHYLGSAPNQNPLYLDLIASGRKDFVPANTIVDKMNELDDPRRDNYFTLFEGEYVGGLYGYPNSYANYSHIDPTIESPTFPGFFMTYTEMLFYLAEAAARGFAVPNTAEEYYNMGITESILSEYFEPGTQAEVNAYLAQSEVAYNAAEWKQKIGTQSWIANYTRGLEAYTTWRRLDYPVFYVAELVESTADIPTRFTYPVSEQTLNAAQ
ncbi:MAG: SusD/RagB family nutrient-binding outer membrane lipoprotein, partial [Cyclobacteriaceae bacterium]|nr:SusD/RagB family nutrient-binding outer membrane lipoprotein [Cyclobacteriaceae bacterium]